MCEALVVVSGFAALGMLLSATFSPISYQSQQSEQNAAAGQWFCLWLGVFDFGRSDERLQWMHCFVNAGGSGPEVPDV